MNNSPYCYVVDVCKDQHAVGEGGIGQQAVPVSRANQSRLSSVWHNFDGRFEHLDRICVLCRKSYVHLVANKISLGVF